MPQFKWSFDAPTGTFKQHALSQRIREASIAQTVFVDHTRPVEGFGRGMGESVTITRIANLDQPDNVSLDESERIPEDEFSISTRDVIVEELGRAVPFTSLAQDLSFFDLENPIQRKLRDQLSLSLDTKAATAFKDTQIKYAPTGASSSNITTNGSFGATATANMNFHHVEELRDYMFDDLHVDPYDEGDYVGIFRTLGLRGIKRDDDFEEWHKYTDPSKKFSSEVGRLEAIRFVESNNANALGKVGSSSVLGEGVVFGADPVVMAESLSPELRAAMPDDFGRSQAVAWYGQLAFKSVWGDSGNRGEANIIHVGSQ